MYVESKLDRSSGPEQFPGSYVVNRVLATRLVQWLKGLCNPRKKERTLKVGLGIS